MLLFENSKNLPYVQSGDILIYSQYFRLVKKIMFLPITVDHFSLVNISKWLTRITKVIIF